MFENVLFFKCNGTKTCIFFNVCVTVVLANWQTGSNLGVRTATLEVHKGPRHHPGSRGPSLGITGPRVVGGGTSVVQTGEKRTESQPGSFACWT